jgi:cation diffusion facilitator family transporter
MRLAMIENNGVAPSPFHSHVFHGEGHAKSERKTWAVIWLCGAMMIAEIVGGLLFGSIALVADGLHMSTHAGALLLAALAYTYARKHANDPNFTFGTGKLGDLAGFSSAIILAMIALLIGYEFLSRIFVPVAIHFREAIPIACLGLAVNVASAWLLSSGGQHHGYSHGHVHEGHDHDRRTTSRPAPGWSCSKYSRMACRRASGCDRRRPRLWECMPSKLKRCGRAALGSGSRW